MANVRVISSSNVDVNLTLDQTIYYATNWQTSPTMIGIADGADIVDFTGSFHFNKSGAVDGGTVTGIDAYSMSGDHLYSVTNMSLSAKALYGDILSYR